MVDDVPVVCVVGRICEKSEFLAWSGRVLVSEIDDDENDELIYVKINKHKRR